MKHEEEFDRVIRDHVSAFEKNLESNQNEDFWSDFKSSENNQKMSKVRFIWAGGMAASLILALVFFVSQYNIDQPIIHSMEIADDFHLYEETRSSTEYFEAQEFIDSNCENLQEKCMNKEFIALRNELDNLEREINNLQSAIEQYGLDEHLIKARVKIENHRSDIAQRMIQILMS